MVKNALVVGGGIGGLAVATALARRGVAVTLFEQAAEITEVGAGLQISPNGLAVLRALGIESALDRRGAVQAEAVRLDQGGGMPRCLSLVAGGSTRYARLLTPNRSTESVAQRKAIGDFSLLHWHNCYRPQYRDIRNGVGIGLRLPSI